MGKELTTEEIIEFVESVGFEFIKRFKNEKYKRTMITVKCPNGHIRNIEFNNFKQRNGACWECGKQKLSEKKRHSIETIINTFKKYGFTILEGIENYKNNTSKLIVKCKNGHIRETNYALFKNAKNKCPECAGKQKITIEKVKNEFLDKGYILLESEFINSHVKMKYKCKKHPNKIREISYNNFKQGKGCVDCAKEKRKLKTKEKYFDIKDLFTNRGYRLLTSYEEYENTHQKLKYICNKHPDFGVQFVTYHNFLKTKHNCKKCISENYRGDHFSTWKGGTEALYDHLRKKLDGWKKDSMEACGYRCVITGGYFDVIHHLYSFNKIVSETLNILGLEFKSKISEYSTEELIAIENLCLELHKKYGLGVCLSKEIHDLFHKIYGKYDNTPEQFEEFKERYKNGEFDDLIGETV